ncbi:hypothetical protein PM082_012387 [Marasmius tenuissimus]|nr:hypothetical protein PM082_012387 [Marasmius tenuissimus]
MPPSTRAGYANDSLSQHYLGPRISVELEDLNVSQDLPPSSDDNTAIDDSVVQVSQTVYNVTISEISGALDDVSRGKVLLNISLLFVQNSGKEKKIYYTAWSTNSGSGMFSSARELQHYLPWIHDHSKYLWDHLELMITRFLVLCLRIETPAHKRTCWRPSLGLRANKYMRKNQSNVGLPYPCSPYQTGLMTQHELMRSHNEHQSIRKWTPGPPKLFPFSDDSSEAVIRIPAAGHSLLWGRDLGFLLLVQRSHIPMSQLDWKPRNQQPYIPSSQIAPEFSNITECCTECNEAVWQHRGQDLGRQVDLPTESRQAGS